jgi:ankyrin repeat protein
MGEKESAEAQGIRLEAFTDALCYAIRKPFNQGALALIESMRNISGYSSSGETPLHTAVQVGNEKMVTTLLEYGAQVNAEHRKTRETPYTIASLVNLTSIKEILSKYKIEYQPQDIIAAAKFGDEVLVEKVLASYPDDFNNQRKALFIARRLRQKKIEKILHDYLSTSSKPLEIDNIARDIYGDTVLHQAVRARNPEQVGKLSREGDRTLVHAYDFGGDSALMLAIRMCHWSGAEALAAAGANIDEALDRATAEKCELWVEKLQGLKHR